MEQTQLKSTSWPRHQTGKGIKTWRTAWSIRSRKPRGKPKLSKQSQGQTEQQTNNNNEPEHDKTNKMTCAPSQDSDQPGHPPSLIRVFTVHSKGSQGPNASSCGQQRLWSDWADAQADQSLLGTQVILLVLSCTGSNDKGQQQKHPTGMVSNKLLWAETNFMPKHSS